MVSALHAAGIEVILDVVYNHTAEGNQLGPDAVASAASTTPPTTGWSADDPRYYMDYTGCGNTLNMRHPRVLQLIMDSLRYWVLEMHVDGFRFDLAAALARELHEVDRLGAFFDIIHQDPVLSQVKLIAEPWDVGEGGYQVGNFPVGWAEWNGRYRDTVRALLEGRRRPASASSPRASPAPATCTRRSGRRPYASINFVTAHDGFTLHDLVSYNDKHNEANGEDNRDGTDNNLQLELRRRGPDRRRRRSIALRERQKRNFLATLLLSQGVPMLLAGDEIGRTQRGNNNAYCQDNETELARLGPGSRRSRRCSTSPQRLIAAAPRASGVPPPPLLPGPPHPGQRHQGHRLAHARRRRDDRRRMEPGLRALPRRVPLGRRTRRAGSTSGRPHRATTTSCCCSTRITRRSTSPCRRLGRRRILACAARHRRRGRPRAARASCRRGGLPACRAARWPCSSNCSAGSCRSARRAIMQRRHSMPFGAELQADGEARFRLWAPAAPAVAAASRHVPEPLPMAPCRRDDGWFELVVRRGRGRQRAIASASTGGSACPIRPRASKPDDVHGASEVVDPPAFDWRDDAWRGRPWHEAVIYELHVGTFTPEGTFAGVDRAPRLPGRTRRHGDRADAGRRFPRRAQLGLRRRAAVRAGRALRPPGGPEARWSQAAHLRGLMVLLDVVYNHFGPEGNYLHAYAPQFFSERHHTPWGAAINFDGAAVRAVRDFFIHNALYWLEEYHFDGLRLDAVHAIADDSQPHVLDELAQAVRAAPRRERPRAPGARERRQRGALPGARRERRARRCTRRSGTTTCITRCTCC